MKSPFYNWLVIIALCLTSWPLLAQTKGDYGYLYCHMSGRGEWTAYALSRDGVHYYDLIGGDSVYSAHQLSGIEGGARDAYLCRAGSSRGYVLATTDMCHAKSHSWSNYGLNLLKSNDLINWTSVTFDFRKGPAIFSDPASPDVYKDYRAIQRVWAPQIIWDAQYVWPDGQRGGYLVYYSLLNSKEDQYDRIFYSYADASFTHLTKPKLLVDWGYAVIDADISYVPADGQYHLLIKKEDKGEKKIFTSVSNALTGPYERPADQEFIRFEGNKMCEGASAFQLIGDATWRVAYVEYTSRPIKYRVCQADKYLRNFHSPEDIQGVANPQHGSFLTLTKKEYDRLQKWSDSQSKPAAKPASKK